MEWLTKNSATSQYAIGPRLRRFSHVAAGKLDLLAISRPYLTELRDATLDTVHLAVLEGNEARVNGGIFNVRGAVTLNGATVSGSSEPQCGGLTCP